MTIELVRELYARPPRIAVADHLRPLHLEAACAELLHEPVPQQNLVGDHAGADDTADDRVCKLAAHTTTVLAVMDRH